MDKIVLLEKMINPFNILNLEFSNLSNIINSIFYNNYFDKYFPAIIGLAGVIIGSLISYLTNKSISQTERNSRLAIQRKNLIYAPIYKELLQLSNYVDNNKKTCYLNITQESYLSDREEEYYYDGERRKSGLFIIWNDIKKDIRKNYIPHKVEKSLNDVNSKIDIYTINRDKIDKEFKELYVKYKIDESYKKIDGMRDCSLNLETPAFLFYKNTSSTDYIKEIYDRYGFSEPKYEELRQNIENLFKNLTKEIDRKDLFESYDLLCESIVCARKEIDKLIYYITNRYELGRELEQYE